MTKKTYPRILVVEDDRDLLKLLVYNLEKEGYQVLSAQDGATGLKLARAERPDLLLLDLMLPKMDGMEVCRILRQESKVPVIMVTAKKEEVDRILGLEIGADDYVTKPFSVRELLARVKAILRRVSPSDDRQMLKAGLLDIDLERYEVFLGKKPIPLSSKEFEFLKVLIQANGKVLTRDQILEKVWGYDKGVGLDTRTIDQHIARLRDKLGSEAFRIVTVKNVGYRFKQS